MYVIVEPIGNRAAALQCFDLDAFELGARLGDRPLRAAGARGNNNREPRGGD